MIRAYVNRGGPTGRGPIVVELWKRGHRQARTFCQEVRFEGIVTLKSVKGVSPGFHGYGGQVHTWVESDADGVAFMAGVTHTEGGEDGGE